MAPKWLCNLLWIISLESVYFVFGHLVFGYGCSKEAPLSIWLSLIFFDLLLAVAVSERGEQFAMRFWLFLSAVCAKHDLVCCLLQAFRAPSR